MPTASTAYILGNSAGTEPYPSNVVTHQLLSGDYTQLCPWLVTDLEERGLWDENMRVSILSNRGSVQSINTVPEDLKAVYRTAWEIDPEAIIDMAADRAPYIDQSQSLSLYMTKPDGLVLANLQLRAWKLGLKTGLYYLRTRPPASALPYGLDQHNDTAVSSTTGSPPPLEPVEEEAAQIETETSVLEECEACSG
ncbi:ribonucleotide reductase [Earliella scabrosa]|nr:ribonucleotide reductase [Earliella scabrosa]